MSTGGGSASSNQFSGVLQLDWQAFVDGLQRAAKGVKQLSDAWSTAAKDVANAAFNVTASVAAVGVGITTAVATMGTSFLAMEENSMIAFNTLLKDGDKARAMFESLVKLGAELPGFSTKAMVDAGKSLLNQRFAAEQVIPLLTAIADQTAAMGGGQEVFNRIIKAISQIKGKGKLSAEEMTQQLGELIPAWQYLADFLQTDVATAQKMVAAGQVDSNTAIAALTAGMQKLGGTAKKMGGTFTGLWAGLLDQADIAAGKMFKPMYEAIKGVMQQVDTLIDSKSFKVGLESIRKSFEDIAREVSAWFRANGKQAMTDIVAGYNKFLTVVSDIARWTVQASPRIREFAAALWAMLDPIVALVSRHPEILAALALWKGASLLGITTAVTSLTTALWSTATAAPAAARGLSTLSVTAIPNLMAALRGVGTYMTATLIPNILGYSMYFIDRMKTMVASCGALQAALAGIVVVGGTIAGLRLMYALLEKIEGKIKTTTEHLSEQANMLAQWAEEADRLAQEAEGGQAGAAGIEKAIVAQEKLLQKLMAEKTVRDEIATNLAKEQATLEGRAQGWGRGIMGAIGVDMVDPAAVEQQKADEALKRANEAQKRLDQLKADLAVAKPAGNNSNQVAPVPNVAGIDPRAAAAEAAKEAADKAERGQRMLDQQQRDVAGRGLGSGFGQMREFMDLGPAEDLMRQYAANFEGASPQLVQALITGMSNAMKTGTYTTDVADALAREFFEGIADSTEAAEAAAEAMRQLSSEHEAMTEKITQQRIAGNLTAMQEVYYLDIANQLLGARQQGVITEAQYLQGQRSLNAHLDYAANVLQTANSGVEQFMGSLLQLKTSGQITEAQFNAFEARMDALAFKTKIGEMSLEQFTVSMQELSAEARQAAEDTDRRKQLGQLAKLTEGMEEGPFKRAVEQRLLSWLQQQQGAQADAFTQNLLRMNGIMPAVAEGFNGLQDRMGEFGRGLSSQFGFGGQGGGVTDVMGQIGTFLNSSAGQIATLSNNIQMEMQRAKLIYQIDNARGLRIMDGIKAMQSQLQMLLTPQEPVLTDSGMFLEDSGLQTPNQQGPSEMKVDLTFPNISRLTNADIRQVVQAIRDENARTGRDVLRSR